MRSLTRLAYMLLGLAAIPCDAGATSEPPERYLLRNGLEVILQRDDRQPYVAVFASYRAGARDDPKGYGGLAHLVEHLTFRGSKHVPDLELLGALERAGASDINATTDLDSTSYYAVVPTEEVPLALWLESERMAFTLEAMSKAKFAIERSVVVSERKERDGTQDTVARLIFGEAYPEAHPYRRFAERGAEESLSLDHARWFYQSAYRPDNATLVLVGSFEKERARAAIERYFGPIVAPAERLERIAAPPVRFQGQALLRVLAQSRRSEVTMFWTVPCDIRACGSELQLLSAVLAGSDESLLSRELLESGVASDVVMDVRAVETHLQVVLSATGTLRSEPAPLHAAIDRVLERMEREGPPADELAIGKSLLIARLNAAFEPLLARAKLLAEWRSPGRPQDLYDAARETERVRSIDVAALRAAAQRHLSRARRIVVYTSRATDVDVAGALRSKEGSVQAVVEGGLR
jgi:zinc protease